MPPLSRLARRGAGWLAAARVPLACALSAVWGTYGYTRYPFPSTDPVLLLIAAEAPRLADTLRYVYIGLWIGTPYWMAYIACSALFIFVDAPATVDAPRPLPPYPAIPDRRALSVVLGEVHHPTERTPSPTPDWLALPARGCHTGIAIIGAIGTGKTAGAIYPYADQILGYRADDPDHRPAALILEAKGDLCSHLQGLLRRHGRQHDYIELAPDGRWRYNPLNQDTDAYDLAFAVASLMQQLWGRSRDPFWHLAASNLVKYLIMLHRVLYDYVTFLDVYAAAISARLLEARMAQAAQLDFLQPGTVTIDLGNHAAAREATQGRARWETDASGRTVTTRATPFVLTTLAAADVAFTQSVPAGNAAKRLQWESIRLWYEEDWTNLEPKLRAAIVEGVVVFLSLFDTDPDLRHTFCPPKDAYDPAGDGGAGGVLPSFGTLIERGYVCGVNFPIATRPALARVIGTLCKMDFQRAVLARIPQITQQPQRVWRDVLFLCDEYQTFVTAGEDHPGGDENFFALSRQARLIPIVATQSVSSLRSTLPGETWRRIMQECRTKIFLAQSDDFSAQYASDLCGRADQLRPSYTISESNRNAGISWLTGRTVGSQASLSTTTTYSWHREPVFEAKVFSELGNMEAIVLAYDGRNPRPASRLYLKPHYLPVQKTHFEYVAEEAL